MSVPNLLPPNVPIVGGRVMSEQWYRWLRDFQAGVADVASLGAIGPGNYLPAESLTTGNNTLTHGLGRVPSGWIAFRPVGAFGVSGSAGSGHYPYVGDIKHTWRGWGNSNTPEITLNWSPADGDILLLVWSAENTTPVVTGITQTGVTWAKTVALSATDKVELWVGTVGVGATSLVTINYSASHVDDVCANIMHISEITSGTPTDTASFDGGILGGPFICSDTGETGGSGYGWSEASCNAGDIMITVSQARNGDGASLGSTNGWSLEGLARSAAATTNHAVYAKVAQDTGTADFRGYSNDNEARRILQACFPSSLSKVGAGASVTIPHGVREVSSSATDLVVESVSDVQMDFWVF